MNTVIVNCPYETRMPFDYWLSKVFSVKTAITNLEEKVVNRSFAARGVLHVFKEKVFALHITTEHGPAEIWVKQNVFNRLNQGDVIAIRYQVGRWSGSVKAKLA